MPNYQLGKIYQILSDQTDKIYIGSTAVPRLCQRFGEHKNDYTRYQKALCFYISSFEMIQYDDARIVLIESYPCNNKDELHAREQYWIDFYRDVCVNKVKAHVAAADKASNSRKLEKQWYENNKEHVLELGKIRYANNKEKIRARQNEYDEKHKERLKAIRNEPKSCTCGNHYTHSNYNRHLKSKKHQAYVELHPEELKSVTLVNGDDQRDTE